MAWLREYLVSVVSASMLSGILIRLTRNSASGEIVRMLCGILITIVLIQPITGKKAQIENDAFSGLKAEARCVTINEMFGLWCQVKRGLKDNTFENYKYMYNLFVRPNLWKEADKEHIIPPVVLWFDALQIDISQIADSLQGEK